MSVTDVILTTAHKSKGLEFTSVQVTDDFISEHLYPNNIQGNMIKTLLYISVRVYLNGEVNADNCIL